MQNQYIIKISDQSFFHHWTMYIDLFQINEDMGRKEKDRYSGKSYTIYSTSSAKKLFKFANQYGDTSVLEAADQIVYERCPRIRKYWNDAKKWRR